MGCSPEFCPDFWFPTRADHPVTHRLTQAQHNARDGRVELASLPFVRVRDWLPPGLRERPLDYGEIVTQTNVALGRVPLVLELETEPRRVGIGGVVGFTLPNAEFALYQLMAEWCRDAVPGVGPDGVGPDHAGWLSMRMFSHPEEFTPRPLDRFVAIHAQTFKGPSVAPLHETPVTEQQRTDNLTAVMNWKSKLLRRIKKHVTTSDLADRFGAPAKPRRIGGFGLKLAPGEIAIREY